MNTEIYLRRRSRVLLPEPEASGELSLATVLTACKNVEPLGYIFSPELIQRCRLLSENQLVRFVEDIYTACSVQTRSNHLFRPMYLGFPEEVMSLSEADLYLNAILHYITAGWYRPDSDDRPRPALASKNKLRVIELGDREDFLSLFSNLVASNASLSATDLKDIEWFLLYAEAEAIPRLPAKIPQKETMAFIAAVLLQVRPDAGQLLRPHVKNATDVLRIAVALSGGDASLAEATKFRNIPRSRRRQFLEWLEELPNLKEDMLRWKARWVRLGEILHPGEFAARFPKAYEAFTAMRNDEPVLTFGGIVEKHLAFKEVDLALEQLKTRPGILARRMDHLMRLDRNAAPNVIAAFQRIAEQVSTPVLLQVRQHFVVRNQLDFRVFFPKGQVAKSWVALGKLPPIPIEMSHQVVEACETALMDRFAKLPALGRTYVDPELAKFTLPFSQRSASKTLRTISRGSRISLDKDCRVLRFFIWWKNGRERTDIDLSAALFDKNFRYQSDISYYNLTGFGGCHSGDIVDAPKGASEFIDIDIARALAGDGRYIVVSLNSYTEQPYCDLPECFAGWMARETAGSGEVYEPRTVQDRLDLASNTRISIPMIFDLRERKMIWADLALRSYPNLNNNVASNVNGVTHVLAAILMQKKTSIADLLALHARARGTVVNSADEAETVFSTRDGFQFRLDEIGSAYMA